VAIQRKLAERVIRTGTVRGPRWIAGVDAAYVAGGAQGLCIAGVVLWDRKTRQIAEQHVIRAAVHFPYVPGLLSFREAPAILKVLRRLKIEPDLFLFDGQGIAHPRRFGLASHVGLLIDRPSIGCAKSLLIGDYIEPESQRGSKTALGHRDETIGMVVRTRDDTKPLYVSIGHRISLRSAVGLVLDCCTRFRLPEPTRLADRLVAQARSPQAVAPRI